MSLRTHDRVELVTEATHGENAPPGAMGRAKQGVITRIEQDYAFVLWDRHKGAAWIRIDRLAATPSGRRGPSFDFDDQSLYY